jgi:hypothetical protein
MKKLLMTITSIALLLTLSLSLVACSSYGKIEKALEEIGYAKVESSQEAEDLEEESDVAVTMHVFSNKDSLGLTEALKINVVIVMEFKSTDEMKEYYEDSDTLQGLVKDIKEDGSAKEFYDSLVEKGYANGNCLVISVNPLVADAVKDAVKNA